MKARRSLFSSFPIFLFITLLLAGCQTPPATPAAATGVTTSTRNNCYSLLHQLMDDEKDVSLLKYIKREHSDVKDLLNQIASASGAASKMLEQFAKQDPSLNLKDLRLPRGEVATRDAIASTKQKQLLSHSGEEFEVALLLTQFEALSYGSHLAKIAAENDATPERARALNSLSAQLDGFYEQALTIVMSRRNPAVSQTK
jgi:hypothetical protein